MPQITLRFVWDEDEDPMITDIAEFIRDQLYGNGYEGTIIGPLEDAQ